MEQKKDRTWFWILNGLIALLLLVFILQNRGPASIKLLGISLEGPRYLLYVILFALGFFAGWLWTYFRCVRRNRSEKRALREEREKEVNQAE
jgi:uncharacterized integral membrane protein